MSHDASKELIGAPPAPPESDGFGMLEKAMEAARGSGDRIAAEFAQLDKRDRQKVAAEFRRKLISPRRPGRKPKASVTAAYRDWSAGMHGVELFRTHIPNWTKHSYWRRKAESQSLMDAIHTRARRERKARHDSSPDSGEHSSS